MKKHSGALILLLAAQAGLASPLFPDSSHGLTSRIAPVGGARGMVSSDDVEASSWGAEVLRQGGSAADAIIATVLHLSVSRPHNASIGGGGFLLVCPPPRATGSSPCRMLDFREMAGAAAHRDLYLKDGKLDARASLIGAKASGVPGVPAVLQVLHERWGKLKWSRLFEEPLRASGAGTVMTHFMEENAKERWSEFNAEGQKILSSCVAQPKTKEPCKAGQRFVQSQYTQTLKLLQKQGMKAFYQGALAREMVSSLRASGGILTEDDFKRYRVVERDPISFVDGEAEIVSLAPPSSGGALLQQLFKYSELAFQGGMMARGWGAAATLHAQVHALSLAFADRSTHFGDPDFVSVPIERLTSDHYLVSRWKDTFMASGARLPPGPSPLPDGGDDTTHLVAVDRNGLMISMTLSINDTFGSRFYAGKTGVLMNDHMDDFAAEPGKPNLFGLIQGEANAIAPGKRPLSSMTATIVRDRQGQARIAIGGAGGPRITSAVYQALWNRLHFGMTLPEALHAPRVHHQWRPAAVRLEKNTLAPEVIEKLRSMGYEVLEASRRNAVLFGLERFQDGTVWGISDPGSEGGAVAE